MSPVSYGSSSSSSHSPTACSSLPVDSQPNTERLRSSASQARADRRTAALPPLPRGISSRPVSEEAREREVVGARTFCGPRAAAPRAASTKSCPGTSKNARRNPTCFNNDRFATRGLQHWGCSGLRCPSLHETKGPQAPIGVVAPCSYRRPVFIMWHLPQPSVQAEGRHVAEQRGAAVRLPRGGLGAGWCWRWWFCQDPHFCAPARQRQRARPTTQARDSGCFFMCSDLRRVAPAAAAICLPMLAGENTPATTLLSRSQRPSTLSTHTNLAR